MASFIPPTTSLPLTASTHPSRRPRTPHPLTSPRMHQEGPWTNWAALSTRAQKALSTLHPEHPNPSYTTSLRELVANDPENPFLWHALAKHVSQTSPQSATTILSEAVQSVPPGRRGGLYEAWGTLELRLGHSTRALSIFRNALSTDPYAPLYVSLATAQTRLSQPTQARATFREGAAQFPSHAPLFRAWAHLESQHGSPDTARKLWRTALEKDPTNARAWRSRVHAEQACNIAPTDLAAVLRAAVAACPADCSLRLQLARYEHRRRGAPAARAVLRPVDSRNHPDVLRMLAQLDAGQGNFERARTYFRRAADVEAAKAFRAEGGKSACSVKALHAWALMETRAGNVDRARAVLDEAKDVGNKDSGVWRAVAELESREGNFEQARKAFQNAIAIDPDDPRLFLAWGKTELLAGDLAKAEMLIDRVAGVDGASRLELGKDAVRGEGPEEKEKEKEKNSFEGKRSPALTPHVLADALRERGMLASRNGQFDASITLLTRASRVEPNYPAGWRLLAQQELRLNGMETTRTVYETALESVDMRSKPQLLHWWGLDERMSGNFDRARVLFRKSTLANPDYMSAWISWGLMEKSRGNVEDACSIFEQASRRAERDVLRAPFIFQAWGRVEELERGRPEAAAEVFQRGVKLAPKSGQLWCSWGLLEERRGNLERARDLFRRATTTDPKCGSAWHSWALLEARRCNYERAGELYRLGNENDPSNSSLLASWAMMEGKERSNMGRSRDLFEQAVTADPYFSPAFHSWGCLEMNVGSVDRARQLFKKAADLRPEDPSPLHTLGMLEVEKCNDRVAAIECWKRAIEVSPGHALSYQSWALLEGRLNGNMDEAQRLFQVAIEFPNQKPSDVALLLQSWASLEEQKGNSEHARELLKKSLGQDRRRSETWHTLAAIEKSRGRRDEARNLLRDGVSAVSPSCTASMLYVLWGTIEAEVGDIEKARELFARGIRANPSDSATWNAYAAIEGKYGSASRAAEIALTAGTLLVREHDANEKFIV